MCIRDRYCACAGTDRAGALVQSLGSAHSRDDYPIGFRPCTLMGFMAATRSALRPHAYSNLRAFI